LWPDQAARVAALDLPGIGFIKESKRAYPNADLASHVLGYVGVDNVGLAGL
jgi:cell division protein FtsI (penicillin-binding protein 3)